KIARYIAKAFAVRDVGLPTGSDQRFVISSPAIKDITQGLTDSVWLFIDIKSVGPRDNFDHTVMSHNQISGDGIWNMQEDGVSNTKIMATGSRTAHPFYCSLAPIYVLS